MTVNVAGPNQIVFVSGEVALGVFNIAGGASGLSLALCRTSPDGLVDNGNDWLGGLQVPNNTRLPFSLSTRFTSLPAGAYQVGICGRVSNGAANWNNNEWSRVTVIVAQQ